MRIRKLFLVTAILVASTVGCQPSPTPTLAEDTQAIKILENELITKEITQTKIFDQCSSSSILKTQVAFSDSNSEANQDELVLGAEVTGGGKIEGAIELEIKGSIEKHFSNSTSKGSGHSESVGIEIPAHTKQEYTIIWKELRRAGTVEYLENGIPKSISYNYRVGLELVSSYGKDVPCGDAQNLSDSNHPSNLLSLNIRKPILDEISTGLTSIWDDNNLTIKDMRSPGKKTYSGIARIGVEYIFPVYWCATNESTLADNRDSIQTTFWLNEKQIPDELTLAYGYKDRDGWQCINTATILGGWVAGEKYSLQIKRNFKKSIFDGEAYYPAGTYIYKIDVFAQ